MIRVVKFFAWGLMAGIAVVPIVTAAFSPLLASRDVAYIVGGMSGVVALSLLLVQPLLAAGYLPGLLLQRKWHRRVGSALVVAVVLHIIGLFITSPDDMTDALLLAAPTPFSVYGVVALWGVVLTAILVVLRKSISLSIWYVMHNALAVIVVIASVVHAVMIEGTMNHLSKQVLGVCIIVVSVLTVLHLRLIRPVLSKRKDD